MSVKHPPIMGYGGYADYGNEFPDRLNVGKMPYWNDRPWVVFRGDLLAYEWVNSFNTHAEAMHAALQLAKSEGDMTSAQ